MIWPLIGSIINVLIYLPRRVTKVKRYGLPFVGVSLG